jgi:curved DNA-binding protein CbpA
MIVTKLLRDAREVLGVPPAADARAIKSAYRRLLAEHPPDADEAAFLRIRGAYDLLVDPYAVAREALFSKVPGIEPPRPPRVPDPPPVGETARLLVRRLAATLDLAPLFPSDPTEPEAP